MPGANEAAVLSSHVPLVRCIYAEPSVLWIVVVLGTLVVNELRVVERSVHDERIGGTVLGSTNASPTLRRIESLQLLVITELLAKHHGLTQGQSPLVDSLLGAPLLVKYLTHDVLD